MTLTMLHPQPMLVMCVVASPPPPLDMYRPRAAQNPRMQPDIVTFFVTKGWGWVGIRVGPTPPVRSNPAPQTQRRV